MFKQGLSQTRLFSLPRLQLLETPVRAFGFYNAQDYNSQFKQNIENQFKVKSDKQYRFAVIGCGPAGFYCAKQIIKNVPNVRVDIYDRNPHPFGLVRTGVAPDHPDMKKIEKDYSEILNDKERCHFFGNVWVGTNNGLELSKLKDMYSGIILAYGATSERDLGLPREKELKKILSSRHMANWYNGSLDDDLDYKEQLDLEHVKDVAIIGNGNVAMDISRVILKDPSLLAPFDAPSHVIEHLKNSNLRSIQMVGRRGAIQTSFTIKEIREVSKIKGIKLYALKEEFLRSMNEESIRETHADFSVHSRGTLRKIEFIRDSFTFLEDENQLKEAIKSSTHAEKAFVLRYLLAPQELIGSQYIEGIKFEKMRMEGQAGHQRAISLEPPQYTNIDCDLLIKSIGYKSQPIEGIPFDTKTHTVPHEQGCVLDDSKKPLPGLYVSGWLKRGPVGIIDSTLRDSIDTFRIIKFHMESDMLPEKTTSIEDAEKVIAQKTLKDPCVNYTDWLEIDEVERKRGQEVGKTREKILKKEQMLEIPQKINKK